VKPLFLLLGVGLLCLPHLADAQDEGEKLTPMLVVSMPSYQNALDDVKYIGSLLRDEIYHQRVNVMLGLLLQAKYLKVDDIQGVDRNRPLGMSVLTDGQSVVSLAMLPLDGEPEQVFESLKPLVGEFKKQDNGLYALGSGLLAGFAKPENGWLYFSQLEEHLNRPLPDPIELFGDLPASYDLGGQLNTGNIPESYRSLLIDQMRIAIEATAQPRESEGQGLFNFRRELARVQSHFIDRGLGQSEQVRFGMKVDAEQERGVAEIFLTPLPDTPLAKHISELKGLKTRYGNTSASAGESDVLVSMNMTGPLDRDGIDEYAGLVTGYRDYVQELLDKSDQVKSDEERTTLKQLAGDIVDVVRATIEAGQLDVAARMVGKGNNRSLVFAGRVANADQLRAAFDKIGELANGDPGFVAVQMNAAEHAGTAIHSFQLKTDPKSQEGAMARYFGGELKLLTAVKDDNVWLALGPQGLDLIKQAMELKETDALPVDANVRLTHLLQFGILMLNQPQLNTFGGMFTAQLAGKDLAHITAQPTADGQLHLHIETESGAIKFAGAMFGQLGPMIINMMQQQQGR
jgi:hypothetical protein